VDAGDQEAIPTQSILDSLMAIDEAPWGDIKGKPIDPRRLSNTPVPYGVQSTSFDMEPLW
jgi:hypothetical protein